MEAPRITREENERIARRERLGSRSIIAVIVAAFLAMMIWGIYDDTQGSDNGPANDPSFYYPVG